MRRKSGEGNEVGMELKYCEHCGGLWVRERGAGTIYCDRCQVKVADLPAPRKRKSRLILPVRPRTVVEEYAVEADRDDEAIDVSDVDSPDLDSPDLDDSDLDDSDLDDSDLDVSNLDASNLDAMDLDAMDLEAGGAA
jgi:hypothetical protein